MATEDGIVHANTLDKSTVSNPAVGELKLIPDSVTGHWFQLDSSGTLIDLTDTGNKVKTSAADTTEGYLNDEITATEGVQKNIQNPAANENLRLRLDIDGLTEESGIDSAADYIPFYDSDAAIHRKIKPDDIGTAIGAFKVKTNAADTTEGYLDDEITANEGVQKQVVNTGGNRTLNFKSDIGGLVEITTLDAAADFLEVLDATDGVHKKIKGSNLLVGADKDQAALQARRSTGFNLLTAGDTVWADISMDLTDEENDATIIEHNNAITDRVEIKKTGMYLLIARGNANIINGATSVQADTEVRVRVNDVSVIDGSLGVGGQHYSGSNTYSEDENPLAVALVSLTSGDFVTPQARFVLDAGSSAPSTFTLENFTFQVISLSSVKGDKGDAGPAGSGTTINVSNQGGAPIAGGPFDNLDAGQGLKWSNLGGLDAGLTIDFHALQYTNSSLESTTLEGANWADVDLDTNLESVAGSYFTKVSSSEFRADFTGKVRLVYSVEAYSDDNDRNFNCRIVKNGTEVSGSVRGDTANNNSIESGNVFWHNVISVSNTDVFKLQFQTTNASGANILADRALLRVELIN